MHTIGIDFGTTKTLVSHVNPRTGQPEPLKLGRGTHLLPTTIYIDANGHYYFGDDADDMIEEETGCYIRGFKMKLGSEDPVHLLPDGSRIFARDLVREYLQFIRNQVEKLVYHGEQITKATITRPVKFSPLQCKELETAALDAGFTEVSFITEPEAAGLAYCHLNAVQAFTRAALVVDWGGGTLDFALVTRKDNTVCTHRQLTEGDTRMGGEKFDERLWLYAQQKLDKAGAHELNHISQLPHVRKAKEMLSSRTEFTLRLSSITGACPPIVISRKKFNELIEDDIQKAVYKMQELIKRIPAEMQPEMILLVGGSCQIPLIQQQLKKASGLPTHAWDRSREAVSLGAALVSKPALEEEENAESQSAESPSPQPEQAPQPAASPTVESNKSSSWGIWFFIVVIIAVCFIKSKCSTQQNAQASTPPATLKQEEQPAVQDAEAPVEPVEDTPVEQQDDIPAGQTENTPVAIPIEDIPSLQEENSSAEPEAADSLQQSYASILYSQGEQFYNNEQYQQAVQYFTRAAERGHAAAQCFLGHCYYDGQGIAQNFQSAFRWYLKAAKQGHATAQNNLGCCYYTGHGVSQDHREAANWYLMAAKQGLAMAQFNLGGCYEKGLGVTQDYNEAASWYSKAAAQGHEEAQSALVKLNSNQQTQKTSSAKTKASASTLLREGEEAEKQGDYLLAAKLFEQAAKLGNKSAQYRLGKCYEKGHGKDIDLGTALDWYRKAAQKNHARSEHAIAKLLDKIHHISTSQKRHHEAEDFAYRAFIHGETKALETLGKLLGGWNGTGYTMYDKSLQAAQAGDYEASVRFMEKAVDAGHAEALYQSGKANLNSNPALGLKHLTFAAAQGHGLALFKLGHLFKTGDSGCPKNEKLSNFLLKQAEQRPAY